MKKSFIESKAMWAGGLLTLYGLTKLAGWDIIPDAVVLPVLTGVGIIGIRDAQN